MSGLIILFFLGIWGFVSYFLAKLIAKPIKDSSLKKGMSFILTGLLFISPVADDIIGGFQFRALCREKVVLKVDEDMAKGKSVFLNAKNINLEGFILPIHNYHVDYLSIDTNEVILSWDEYRAKGGWLSRLINFPQGRPPYTFNGICYPKDAFGRKNIFERLEIKQLKK